MSDLNALAAPEIGRRLRVARETAGILQGDAAEVLGLSRPSLAAIEKGKRRIRIQELQVLAKHYGLSANALLRREAVHIGLVPRFRSLASTTEADTTEAARMLSELVQADVELENLLGIKHRKNYPPECGITEGRVEELAEQHAQEMRDWFGIGSGPIADIFALLEWNLGVRLYQRRLPSGSKIAGLFAYDHHVGACILLNANQRIERRRFSAAHELGHFCGTRYDVEVYVESKGKSRAERYADAFAQAFLTPRQSFSESFRNVTAGGDRLLRRHVILLAHQHRISRQACVLRLEQLRLVKHGTWDWFVVNGGITDVQAQAVLGEAFSQPDTSKSDADRPVPHRTSLMAHLVWKRGLLTEGQLAELLCISRLETRQLIDEIETEECVTDELLKLPA